MGINPPRPKGPPLNAMRAFEAAGRHQSFVRAADELSVSPGAISQHIKTLEGWSGVALFQRNAQGVELTSAGRGLIEAFTTAFDALSEATHGLRNLAVQGEFHIAALPSVAQLWLPARLGMIREALPDMRFSVTAMETPPNLTRELFDLCVFIGLPSGQPDERIIAPDEIIPVCAPSMAKRITRPEDLNSVPLLHDRTWSGDWARWSKATGTDLKHPSAGPSYSLYGLAVEEAKSGAGALMGHKALIEEPLRNGSLVAPFPRPVATGQALLLGLPHTSRRRAGVDEIARLLGA